jgi:hypothetical protein
MPKEPRTLGQLLDRIGAAAHKEQNVSLGDIIEQVGSRSFGPLLLMAGAIAFSPLSGIPTLPTFLAVLVVLLAAQMLLHRRKFWLPHWLLNRSVSHEKVERGLRWLRPPARVVDRCLQARLTAVVGPTGVHLIAIICLLVAVAMPVTEMVPFSATTAGVVLSAFGLSLIAHDGLVALLAFLCTGLLFGFLVYNLL